MLIQILPTCFGILDTIFKATKSLSETQSVVYDCKIETMGYVRQWVLRTWHPAQNKLCSIRDGGVSTILRVFLGETLPTSKRGSMLVTLDTVWSLGCNLTLVYDPSIVRVVPKNVMAEPLSQLTPYCPLAPYYQTLLATHCPAPQSRNIDKGRKRESSYGPSPEPSSGNPSEPSWGQKLSAAVVRPLNPASGTSEVRMSGGKGEAAKASPIVTSAGGPGETETHFRTTDNPMLRGYDVYRTDKPLFDRASGVMTWLILPSLLTSVNIRARLMSWRVMVSLSGLVPFVLLSCFNFVRDSPRVLLYRWKFALANDVLSVMYAINHSDFYTNFNKKKSVKDFGNTPWSSENSPGFSSGLTPGNCLEPVLWECPWVHLRKAELGGGTGDGAKENPTGSPERKKAQRGAAKVITNKKALKNISKPSQKINKKTRGTPVSAGKMETSPETRIPGKNELCHPNEKPTFGQDNVCRVR
uniref:Uncharacterized protein n=1 Tax=Timema bartmani TaxID=61472 RepID=A0A7R9FBP1_9NEOP|nr:unnamed protein product [Timema bartmani]